MSNELTCSTCTHFKAMGVSPETLKPATVCRRYPKTLFVQVTPNGQIMRASGNPEENADSPACGEYKERLASVTSIGAAFKFFDKGVK